MLRFSRIKSTFRDLKEHKQKLNKLYGELKQARKRKDKKLIEKTKRSIYNENLRWGLRKRIRVFRPAITSDDRRLTGDYKSSITKNKKNLKTKKKKKKETETKYRRKTNEELRRENYEKFGKWRF